MHPSRKARHSVSTYSQFRGYFSRNLRRVWDSNPRELSPVLAVFKIASGASRYRAVTCVVGRLPAACRTAIPHISRAAPRDRPSTGHLASGRLDRASCRSAGTFASWGAVRRAGDPIDPERSHAAPGSTATFAALDRGPARLLPSRLLAQPSPAPPYGDNAGKA